MFGLVAAMLLFPEAQAPQKPTANFEFSANAGNVEVRGPGFRAVAHRANWNSESRELTLTGRNNEPALLEQSGPSGHGEFIKADKIVFAPFDGAYKTRGARSLATDTAINPK